KEAGVVLAPFHAGARAEVLHGPLPDVEEVLHDGVRARQIDRAIRVCQAERLFLTQRVLAASGIVFHVAARSLVREPFTHISLGRAGTLRELCGRERPLRQLAIETELIANRDQYCAHGCTEIGNGLAEERLDSAFVYGHDVSPFGMRESPRQTIRSWSVIVMWRSRPGGRCAAQLRLWVCRSGVRWPNARTICRLAHDPGAPHGAGGRVRHRSSGARR